MRSSPSPTAAVVVCHCPRVEFVAGEASTFTLHNKTTFVRWGSFRPQCPARRLVAAHCEGGLKSPFEQGRRSTHASEGVQSRGSGRGVEEHVQLDRSALAPWVRLATPWSR